MNILLIEPFFTGSHKFWAEGYQQNSAYNLSILSLKEYIGNGECTVALL